MRTLRHLPFFVAAMLLLPARVWAEPTAYVIADQTTGHILESQNGQKKLQIGSLTKIASAMVVLDWADAKGADLGQMATVPASGQTLGAASSIGLHPGSQCSVRDLLYASLMQSDNHAAETLADHVGRALGGGGEASPVAFFVAQMNALARRLGMTRTLFLNAHGLDSLERKLPYSTADDLARLTAYAMGNAAFRFHVSQRERKIALVGAAGEPSSYLLRNTNEALGAQAIDGVKTGTTRKAGACLIVSAPRPPESRQEGAQVIITPRRLNVVILGAPERFDLAPQLVTRGWQAYDQWAADGRPVKGKR